MSPTNNKFNKLFILDIKSIKDQIILMKRENLIQKTKIYKSKNNYLQ
jgi:hypothetical protein